MTGYDDYWKQTEFVSGDYILFTDICPKMSDLWDLHERGVEFQVLDHHISSMNALDEYRKIEPDKYFIINQSIGIDQSGKCGATMTWDWFARGNSELQTLRPLALRYIEIADTWAWEKDENAKYITQYIRVITKQGEWKDMAKILEFFDYQKALDAGKILMQRLEQDVQAICKKSHYLYIDGIKVLSVNSGHDLSTSEVGHELSERAENGVGLVYNIAYDEVKISVRGKAGTTIAREIAQKLGGGGHNEASGARQTIPEFMKLFNKPA
jgi:oligoribonuclease NrnB/cAMP/cGMP phosphodiesterase (DHH superfamily)